MATIERIENLMGCAIPAELIDWINGDNSALQGKEFTLEHPSGRWVESIDSVFGASEIVDLLEQCLMNRECGCPDFPQGMVPLCGNGSGDIVFYGVGPQFVRHVVFMFHEECDPEVPLSGIYDVAPSLSDWVSSLSEAPNQDS